MAQKVSNCPHVVCVGLTSWEDVKRKKQTQDECDTCEAHGPNLWLCLHDKCLYMGCGESALDHSSQHAEDKSHCLTLNMTTFRIWCYQCECEVYKDRNNPALLMGERTLSLSHSPPLPPGDRVIRPSTPPRCHTPTHDDSESSDDDEALKPRGLVGLQNIGNTCYMNSAIQSLSNCPPLARFFLDCPGYVRTDKKPMLSKCYMKLMSEMWHKKRPSYVVPSSVASGIKLVHPMFRGFTQQDAQEFLRCFMDQIHEELKQAHVTDTEISPTVDSSPEGDGGGLPSQDSSDDEGGPGAEKGGGEPTIRASPHHRPQQLYHKVSERPRDQSDVEYETCDSGQSSERTSTEPSLSGSEEGLLDPAQGVRSSAVLEDTDAKTEERSIGSHGVDSGMGSSSNTLASGGDSRRTSKDQDASSSSSTTPTNASPTSPSDIDIELSDAHAPQDKSKAPQQQQQQQQRSKGDGRKLRSRTVSEKSAQSPHGKAGKKKPAPEYHSVVSDIFDGKLLSSVQCLTCERVSSTRETFQDLSLPIPGKDYLNVIHTSRSGGGAGSPQGPSPSSKGSCGEVHLHQGWFSWLFTWMRSWFWGPVITLRDCLATFFSADELKGDNMYSCEKCKKLRNGMKYSKVLKLPEILCIHLKRFRHEFMFSSKINQYVSFPLEGLDMGPYLHKTDCMDQMTLYDLVAVICHHGTAGGGHYTAYAQNYVNAQWYEYDDQYVTEVDLQQVENCEAYVLFYRKRNDHMIPVRQKAEQILEIPESTFLQFYISKQWINKFNTFAEPGPINNNDFLCHHGGVHPHKYSYVNDLVQEIPQKLWEYLHDRFGGGPAVNRLYLCDDCQLELDRLKTRQRTEMDTFVKLHEEFQNEDYCGKIYAISMSWFKEWESFVRNRTNDPPGPVDNSKICVVRNSAAMLRMNSDYGQLSQEMWAFLYDIYGGGPELLIKQNRPPTPPTATTKPGFEEDTGNEIKA